MPVDETRFFICYAREDVEFVRRLTKELRSAGADLWMDRQDILAGQIWDRAVQEALKTCQGMIVVLSSASVDSDNVMDELVYAIDRGKQVIPVLYQDCDIPFRISRVHYVDFTAAYDTGFADLLRALRIEQPAPVQETPSDAPSIEQPKKTKTPQRPATKAASTVASAKPTRRERLKGALAVYGIGVVFFLFIFLFELPLSMAGVSAVIWGMPGAIAGAISGTDRRVIVAAIIGFVVIAVPSAILLQAFEVGASGYLVGGAIIGWGIGTISGAIVGVILKKRLGWEKP